MMEATQVKKEGWFVGYWRCIVKAPNLQPIQRGVTGNHGQCIVKRVPNVQPIQRGVTEPMVSAS
jgi:hypothetical protein